MSNIKENPLQCLIALFETLDQRGIRYCHWKSNAFLCQALQGQTDLDLLVDRRFAQAFHKILGDFGLKAMLSPVHRQYPAIEDYLGFDSETGTLFHLHVHYQLVLGEQFVKNYRLPLECEILASACRRGRSSVMIPAPEWELVILVLRILLKIRDRDLIKAWLGRAILPRRVQTELEHLVGQADREELKNILAAQKSIVPGDIILAFLEAWQANQLTSQRLFCLRHRLRRALSPYQRWPRWRATGVYLIRAMQRYLPKRYRTRKRLATGGLAVALVGADGAGKSTLVTSTGRWLQWKLNVSCIHLGSSQPSYISWGVRLTRQVFSSIYRFCVTRFGEKNVLTQVLAFIYYRLVSVHNVTRGMDRYLRFRSGIRAANQGMVVLFDRFPLPEIYDVMDGPRINPAGGGIYEKLARLEEPLYRAVTRPDHIIVLHVSPEVSLSRKPNHQMAKVTSRSTALANLKWQDETNMDHVDADAPLEQVSLQVKRIMWELL